MAASKTTLTGGGFQDSEGNPLVNGYLTMKLSQDASVSGVGNICSGIEIKIQLDANGNVVAAQSVWANGVLSPANTFYKVTGYTAQGQRAWGPNNQQVGTGSSFNVGVWTPNSVIQWFPTVGATPLAVEVRGAAFSSTTLLNFESSDSSVTITDEGSGLLNLQSASTVPAFSTSGQGGFISMGLSQTSGYGLINAGGTVSTTVNQVAVFQFILESSFTIRKVGCFVVDGSAAFGGATVNFGIYAANGNKLLDTGALSASTNGTPANATLGSPVTLPPGVYYFAQSASQAVVEVLGFTQESTGFTAMVNVAATRTGFAANATAAGVMPSTLGTITATTAIAPAAVLFAV